jgi:RNA polymerase sigma-70 factor, ECF subfamily
VIGGLREIRHSGMDMRPLALLARARSGQAEAIGELCEHYRKYLRVVVRSSLRPKLREQVELSDVVQEVLVEIVRQFPGFTGDDETALLGWMRRLVGQKLADLARFHNRLKRGGGVAPLSLDSPQEVARSSAATGFETRLLDMLSLSQSSPSEAASRREQTDLLARALDHLPAQEVQVLWLHYAEGHSFTVIGEHMGLSRKQIRVIWARGLKLLRRTMGRQSR